MLDKHIVEAKFLRAGIKAHKTFIWKDADINLQKEIVSEFPSLNTDDIIIVYKDRTKLLLLNKEGIVKRENNSVEYLMYLNIDKIFPYKQSEEIFNKNQINTLTLILKDSKEKAIPVEEGTWHAIFNIIKWIINQSQ